MKEIKYLPEGTKVYIINNNKIEVLIISKVYININGTNEVIDYNLSTQHEPNKLIRKNSNFVYESLEELKEITLKQFDELTPKDIGEFENKETVVS